MTDSHHERTSPLSRSAPWVLPRRARQEQEPEAAAVFAEATAGAGRPAMVREALDVAAHGLRLRCGVGLTSTPAVLGALVALAALAVGWRRRPQRGQGRRVIRS